MTSEEIRSRSAYKDDITIEAFKVDMLQEIAAQLAELNEHFRKADESVFGVKETK